MSAAAVCYLVFVGLISLLLGSGMWYDIFSSGYKKTRGELMEIKPVLGASRDALRRYEMVLHVMTGIFATIAGLVGASLVSVFLMVPCKAMVAVSAMVFVSCIPAMIIYVILYFPIETYIERRCEALHNH